ncbi:MAG TPA: hydrophobe/amphiphile efflux-1 family RND transporter, partial [Cryomorphaceae bacterium]|nr:hydrophobe/amphiphile efflux-1 family RND transporter [Cryomorphaceae bacterium]
VVYQRIGNIPGVRSASIVSGRNFFSGSGSSYGLGFVLLDSFEERDADSLSSEAITQKMFMRTAGIADAKIIFFTPPSVPGFGASDGFEVRLLDRTARDIRDLDQVATEFSGVLSQRPEISYANNSFSTTFPQLMMEVNIPKAKEAGVPVSDILSAMQGYIGGFYAADFSRFGKQFRVFVQSKPEDREEADDLNSIFVRNTQGEMAPISEFVSLERTYGPQTIGRFNLFNNVTLNGGAAPGYSSGDAIRAIQEEAEKLPADYDIAFSGITREEIASAGQAGIIFALSILFVYFFLAAQYESYVLPLAVLLSLPIGVAGAYASISLMGLENNIYFQIALIMLLGLLAKNAILIVEFARQRRQHGLSITEAAVEGARVRLRPILMTSFAFILGLLPLALANGVGAVGNRSIGTGAVGGLLVGTVIGVFVIPVLFIVFQYLQEKVSSKPAVIHSNETKPNV